jgi:cytochrome c oxidase cbb3-type subunit 3
MRIEIKAAILGVVISGLVLELTFGIAPFLGSLQGAGLHREVQAKTGDAKPLASPGVQAEQGRSLFARNCAHCHGDDARGDEGPTLYNLAMSDARIAKRIKEGIKGEMPKFGSKLNDVDVAALIAYLRTLND